MQTICLYVLPWANKDLDFFYAQQFKKEAILNMFDNAVHNGKFGFQMK